MCHSDPIGLAQPVLSTYATLGQTTPMKNEKPPYHGFRYPPEIIGHSVWLYHRFCLSLRDVEELMAERGIKVSYESIRH